MKCRVIGFYGGSTIANNATSGYLVESDLTKIMLDCGAGVISQIQNLYDLNKIDHCILSHYHYDHFSDIGAFIYHRLIQKQLGNKEENLRVYTQKDEIFFNSFKFDDVSDIIEIDENSRLKIADIDVSFMVSEHPIKCLAIKLQSNGKCIVYTADAALDKALANFASNCDLLITECSLYPAYNGKKSGHMNTSDVAELINLAKPKTTILSHLPIYGDHQIILEEVSKNTTQKVMLAEKFLQVKL